MQSLTETSDDDIFRSTTRTMLYNYVKNKYKNRLENVLNVNIPQEEEKFFNE
jgi:hypothetical protein